MSKFATIEEYNNDLIKSLIKKDLIDYFKYIHHNYYQNINISFMDYFLEICKDDDKFIINHQKLKEYKVINNIDTSRVIKTCLNQYNLIENIDYRVDNVIQQDITHGGSNKKEYKLTPTAFKLCLIRAKNSKIYANYYLLLEKVFKYYNDYQFGYQEHLLTLKDDKIDKLMLENKEQTRKINELLGYSKEIKEQNNELLENTEILDETVYDLSNKVDDLYITIDDIKEDRHEKCENNNDNDVILFFY